MTEQETIDKIVNTLRSVGCDHYYISAYDAHSVMVRGCAMYERPPNIDDCANALGEIVGSIEVLLDPVSDPGCESCDWGSEYGTEFLCRRAAFIPSRIYSGDIQ